MSEMSHFCVPETQAKTCICSKNPACLKNRQRAPAENYIAFSLFVVFIPIFPRPRETRHRSSSKNSVKVHFFAFCSSRLNFVGFRIFHPILETRRCAPVLNYYTRERQQAQDCPEERIGEEEGRDRWILLKAMDPGCGTSRCSLNPGKD